MVLRKISLRQVGWPFAYLYASKGKGAGSVFRNSSPWVFILDFTEKRVRIRDDLDYIDDPYTLLHDDGDYTMAIHRSPTGGGVVGDVVIQTTVVSWRAGHLLWTRTTGAQVKSAIFSCR